MATPTASDRHQPQPPQRCTSCRGTALRAIGPIPSAGSFAGRTLERPLRGGVLWDCKNCRLQFRWPRLPLEELNALYRQGASDTWEGAPTARADWSLAAALLKKQLSEAKILDVGSFDGSFLTLLPATWRRDGIEINERAARRSEEKGVRVIAQDWATGLSELGETYDAVAAFDVIEHVEDPLELVRAMALRVRPGGLIIVASGNSHAPSWRFLGSRYWYCTIAEHVSFINPEWCRRTGDRLKLEVAELTAFSHAEGTNLRLVTLDWAKAVLYRFCPSLVRYLRRRGFGKVDVSAHGALADYPPCSGHANDHLLVVYRKL